MIETQQEKKVKIAALHVEIDGNRRRQAMLQEQLDELTELNLAGYEPQIALLTSEVRGCERAIEAAAKELMIRTGSRPPEQPVKRGPGRPRKEQ